jgi:hypothetical protein
MTSPGWDEYVSGGDLGVTSGESDVAYAGIDAASASAVTTDIADSVIADAPASVVADPPPHGEVAEHGDAHDWADWAAAGDESADSAAGFTDIVATVIEAAELDSAEQDLGESS